MTDVSSHEPPPMGTGLIAGCILSAALIVGTVAWCQWGPTTEEDWEREQQAQIHSGADFPPLNIDYDHLAQRRSDYYREPDLSLIEDEVTDLHVVFRQANRAQFPNHGEEPVDETAEQLVMRAAFMAADILLVSGVRGFQSVGDPLFEQCEQGLEDLLDAIRSGDLPLAQALEDPPADRFAQYRQYCGNFLPFLHQRNLVDESGEWTHPHARAIVEIFQRYRWADLIGGQFPVQYQLAPYELELFYRWRIEDEQAFSVTQRRDFLDTARPFLPNDYDYDLAETRLRAADRDPDRVLELFEELAQENPENEVYDAIYEQVRRQQMMAGP